MSPLGASEAPCAARASLRGSGRSGTAQGTGAQPLREAPRPQAAPARRAARTAPRPGAGPHFPARRAAPRRGLGSRALPRPHTAHLPGPRLAPWPPSRCGAARPRPPPPPPGRGSPTPRSPPPAAATAAPAYPQPGHSLATSPRAEPAVPHPPPASAARDCWYRPSVTPSPRPIQGLLPRGPTPTLGGRAYRTRFGPPPFNPWRPWLAPLNSLHASTRLSGFSLPPHPAYINWPLTSL